MLCAWCGWVSGFHRSSSAAEVTWVASLALVVVLAVLFGRGRRGQALGWSVGTATEPWPRAGRGGGRLALRGTSTYNMNLDFHFARDSPGKRERRSTR